MDRNFVAALAVLTLLAGSALYFLSAAHEREVAGLRGLLDEARRQAAESEQARKAAEGARVGAEKPRAEVEEIRRSGVITSPKPGGEEDAREAEAKKAADAAAREAREAARAEAMRLRIESARKRAEEESARPKSSSQDKDRVEQPRLPEVKLKPPA